MNDHDVDHYTARPVSPPTRPETGAVLDLAHLQRISLAAHYLAQRRCFDRWDDLDSWLAEEQDFAQAERNLSVADTVIRIDPQPQPD